MTIGLMAAENEKGFLEDAKDLLNRLVPLRSDYHHAKVDKPENARAQLQAMLLRSSLAVTIIDGKVERRNWQKILFVELDGARENRKVNITVIKESIPESK